MAGCSLAHHCARLGRTDLVLLDRDQLTSGATWHAAGLCTLFHWDPGVTELLLRSRDAYRSLDAQTPGGIGWRPVGSLRLATDPAQLAEYEAVLLRGRELGLSGSLLDPDATRLRWPLLDPGGVVGSAHLPAEGYVDPARAAGAFAGAAREAGARVLTGCAARAIEAAAHGCWRVVTDQGSVTTPTLVVAAGQWSPELARPLGVRLPVVGMQHQHGLTAAVAGLRLGKGELPVLRDPTASFYIRQDQAGFLCGPFESDPVVVAEEVIAGQRPFQLRPADPDRLADGLGAAARRLPILDQIGIRSVVTGIDAYTPDGLPLVGEWPGLPGLVWLTGFSLFGIAFGAGVGALLAERLVRGGAAPALQPLAAQRFGTEPWDDDELRQRARATYAAEYRPPAGRREGLPAGGDDAG